MKESRIMLNKCDTNRILRKLKYDSSFFERIIHKILLRLKADSFKFPLFQKMIHWIFLLRSKEMPNSKYVF